MSDYEDFPSWWWELIGDVLPKPTKEEGADALARYRAAREEYLVDPEAQERVERIVEEVEPEWQEFVYMERVKPWRDAVWFELPDGTSYDVFTEGLTKLGYIERTEGLAGETRYRITQAGRRRAEELKENDQ